ncbi:general substrate transporter [Thelonectria olida]|uniref:General substrate transporter n=1 Tax=Thelonectria olida TaxID=1576542 RepID=A0A9P9ARA5_9HYPO|nr:general substrate transporter [Thelonectria olida]
MFLQKFVHNEAIKSDPPEIYNLRTVMVSLIACGGALLFGMDMGIIGGVLANLSSNIVSVIQAGAFAGCIIAMWLANRIGRRLSLITVSVLVFIGVALQAAASGHIAAMYIGRFITGIAIGIASTVNPLYVSENAPRGIRGLLTGFYQLSIVTGLTPAFWINYGCLLHVKGHATLPAVFLFVGMLFANESPRFLAQKTPEKALAVLAKLRGLPVDHPYIQSEMEGISAQLEEERALAANSSGLTLIKEAFTVKSYRRRTFLCITMMMWSNLTGTNAMTYYSPAIFKSVGMSSSSAGLFATGIYGIVKMVSCAIFIFFVTDSLGRRKSLLWTAIVQGFALFYVGFFIRYSPPKEGSPLGATGYIAIVAIYIFAAAYQFGWGPVVWTYTSEIPAARMRALQMGMATASQWLFNFVVAKSTPSMIATLGSHGFGTYFVYGSFCFTMVVFAWLFVPETKGLALEDMDELFSQNNVRGKFVPTRSAVLEAIRDAKGEDGRFEHLEKA